MNSPAPATPPPPIGVVAQPCAVKLPLSLDWGQVCRYAADNAALPPATKRRVIFFGDSITELWIKRDPTLFQNDVLDRGISGETTSQMLVRFRQDVIDLHPAVVQILAGTNDIAGNTGPTTLAQIQGNIQTMAELAKAHGITVMLASIPPSLKYNWQPSVDPRPSIAAMNAWLKAYAKRNGFIYIDYYAVLNDGNGGYKAGYSSDGVHPSVAGFAAMRPVAQRAVKEALKAARETLPPEAKRSESPADDVVACRSLVRTSRT